MRYIQLQTPTPEFCCQFVLKVCTLTYIATYICQGNLRVLDIEQEFGGRAQPKHMYYIVFYLPSFIVSGTEGWCGILLLARINKVSIPTC